MRLLHTMLRVGDLDRSIKFYTELLGMKLLRREDYPEGKFTLAFVGYEAESTGTVIERPITGIRRPTISATASATWRWKSTTRTRPATKSRRKAAR